MTGEVVLERRVRRARVESRGTALLADIEACFDRPRCRVLESLELSDSDEAVRRIDEAFSAAT